MRCLKCLPTGALFDKIISWFDLLAIFDRFTDLLDLFASEFWPAESAFFLFLVPFTVKKSFEGFLKTLSSLSFRSGMKVPDGPRLALLNSQWSADWTKVLWSWSRSLIEDCRNQDRDPGRFFRPGRQSVAC
ncbi:hypothetical protein BpHYR1_032507 [Brachionus plicatilis]|uniref:Uncharacterized protein n=1 Tax=Brachionus plicatilis TaxID=10195 RepID=A0A3M7Q4T0_BRAPC|nr:hypothetical protein BpHYR1_032507 [Brachionus plicatilis]